MRLHRSSLYSTTTSIVLSQHVATCTGLLIFLIFCVSSLSRVSRLRDGLHAALWVVNQLGGRRVVASVSLVEAYSSVCEVLCRALLTFQFSKRLNIQSQGKELLCFRELISSVLIFDACAHYTLHNTTCTDKSEEQYGTRFDALYRSTKVFLDSFRTFQHVVRCARPRYLLWSGVFRMVSSHAIKTSLKAAAFDLLHNKPFDMDRLAPTAKRSSLKVTHFFCVYSHQWARLVVVQSTHFCISCTHDVSGSDCWWYTYGRHCVVQVIC